MVVVDVPEDAKPPPPPGVMSETINSVLEDIQCIESRLSDMAQKLSIAVSALSEEKFACNDMDKQEEKKQASLDTHSATRGKENLNTVREITTRSTDHHLGQSDPDTETNQSTQNIRSDNTGGQQSSRATGRPSGTDHEHPGSIPTHRDSGSMSKHRVPMCDSSGKTGLSTAADRGDEGLMEKEGVREKKTKRRDGQLEEENQRMRHGWVMKG